MAFVELTQEQLYMIDGGGWLKDLVDDIAYTYDAAKSLAKGFVAGWNSK